jgi:hypothetical protein
MVEASLITTENSKVARLDTEVLDNCPGDLFELLLGSKGRVEGIPNLLEDADTADALHADHLSGALRFSEGRNAPIIRVLNTI